MTESVIPTPQISAKSPNKKIKFIIGGIVIIVAVVALVITSIDSTGAYYMTVAELNQQSESLAGQKIRVSGGVVQESEDWNPTELMLKFKMTDESGEQVLVSFHGSRPSNFSRATEAIVEGEMLSDGSFRADNLLLKCPSRYEEAPEVTEFEAID